MSARLERMCHFFLHTRSANVAANVGRARTIAVSATAAAAHAAAHAAAASVATAAAAAASVASSAAAAAAVSATAGVAAAHVLHLQVATQKVSAEMARETNIPSLSRTSMMRLAAATACAPPVMVTRRGCPKATSLADCTLMLAPVCCCSWLMVSPPRPMILPHASGLTSITSCSLPPPSGGGAP